MHGASLEFFDEAFYLREKYNTSEKCVIPFDGDVNLKNLSLTIY